MSDSSKPSAEIQRAFIEHERSVRVHNFRVACITACIFMPAGWTLDLFVYPDKKVEFLLLRLLCSALLLFIWWFIKTPVGGRYERLLGFILPALPTICISLMIYLKDGAESPYYAGLNLVLLGAVIILRWSVRESALILSHVVAIYLVACLLHGTIDKATWRTFYNNIYFLLVTGAFVIIGSHFYNRLRYREFSLRYELDRQFKQLQEAEAQLVQTEKLASLGRMSAGIIHEINNPLNYAKTGLYALKNKTRYLPAEQQSVHADTIKDVEDGLDRVKNIVSDLRGFTAQNDEGREEVAVAELVEASVRFVSHEWGKGVELQKNIPAGQIILANKNKLIQVCVNLLENSLQALKEKQFTNGELPTVAIESSIENDRTVLRFHDNGPGIKSENLNKVFDPFFTTKDVGEGMGLGLSICYRIVQEFDGQIRVKSEPGKYCEFTLEFPAKG